MFLLKHKLMLLACLALIICLSGCVTHYRHPNYEFNSPADFANFDVDVKACQQSADSEYCQEFADKPVTICVADGKGGHTCREQKQKKCAIETLEQCLNRKGWRRTDANGNYL